MNLPKKRIVITPRGFAAYGLDYIQKMKDAGFEVVCNDTGSAYTKDVFYRVTEDADGLIVGAEKVDKNYIDTHPKLKAVVKFGVGVDNIDLDYCNEKGIFVSRTIGTNSRSVAETVIGFILLDSKNLYQNIKNTKENKWVKITGYQVLDKNIGVIGFGSIGREIAKLASGIGMNVFVNDICDLDDTLLHKYNAKRASFDEIIKNCDFISLNIPLSKETINLISKEELNSMKPTAVLINTARGGIVNENDLYEALYNHTIKAAYFDVFSSEPPSADTPLLKLPNFYLTPHIASRSAEAERNTAKEAARIILEALAD